MTDTLLWAKRNLELLLVRMEAANLRERECFRRSAECILRSQELLSRPLPEVWPKQRQGVSTSFHPTGLVDLTTYPSRKPMLWRRR
jgi:hypothetical protein